MNQQVIWQSTSQENNLISNDSQHSSNYDSKYIGKEDIQDNRNNRILGMSYNSNSNSNSNSKERCKTDPDSDSEIKKQRKVVKNFIQESQQKLKDNQKLLKQDLDLQSERIHNRIKNRRYSKPMLKSSSCEVYFSKEYQSECTSVADTTSIVDTEDFEDQLQEDIVLELDIQRDEKIYRIVRHYNNQIDNLRALKMDDDTLKIMVDLERKKWEEIEIIQVQYDQIKLEQSTIRKQ